MFEAFTITVKDSLPFVMVLAISPSGPVGVRLVGDHGSRSIFEACEALKAAAPDARLVLFREDERPKYRMCGPSPDRYGEGWYVGGRVRDQPVLVRAARIKRYDPPMAPIVLTGTVVDTGEVVHDMPVTVVYGTDLADARQEFGAGTPWPQTLSSVW